MQAERVRTGWVHAGAAGALVALGMAAAPAARAEAEAQAAKPAIKTAQDVHACMAKNLVTRGALRDLTMAVKSPDGQARQLRLRLFWKPSKTAVARVNLRLMEPMAIRGSSYLLLIEGGQEDVHFHLPAAERSIRITGKNMAEPLWGTDFSYGEIKQVLGFLATGESLRKADAMLAKRPVYVLDTKTSEDLSGYERVVSYVDQASCTLLKSEFYLQPDAPRKVLEGDVSTLLQADVYWAVLAYTMRDVARGSETRLELSDLSFDERLPERLFKPDTFFQPFE